VLADFQQALAALAEVEGRMAMVLAELGLAELVTSIRGVSVVGAAAILAETGNPARFDDAKAVVKHAGLCPRDNASGAFAGKTTISGRGRPLLRLAAWRAVGGALPHNPVFAARYAHLTSRQATGSATARPVPRSPRPCCASCGSSASTGSRGSFRSPAASPARR